MASPLGDPLTIQTDQRRISCSTTPPEVDSSRYAGSWFMLLRLQFLSLAVALLTATCVPRGNARAEGLIVPHPDDSSRKVEYFIEQPSGAGPWPAVVFVHGHQESSRRGGKDFVKWGVLDRFAKRGYLAVAISQPGYGDSSGPADFCGTFTQRAVLGVIEKLKSEGLLIRNRIVIEGISRGAIVASLVAAHDPSIAGIVLISGLYDLNDFVENAKSAAAALIARSIKDETGGGAAALQARSALNFVRKIKASALIINGARDDRTDATQARRLAGEMSAHGGKARAIIYPAYGHQIPVDIRDKEIDPFIENVLRK